MSITLMQPKGSAGAGARKLLEDAGISHTTIFKSEDSRISLSIEGQAFSWSGIKGVRGYIATLTKK